LKKKRNQGLTLVEIIVALALIGIMAASFLTVFYGGYSTIFAMGRKTQAMNEIAQTYMDMLYKNYNESIPAEIGDSTITVFKDTTSTYAALNLVPVTITVNYQDGRTVKLTSLIPK
jgi:prepilin-type N-terminal cleavage/methylation domain-containing protein